MGAQRFYRKYPAKRLTIVHGFRPKTEKFDFGKRIPYERASQEEQNDPNFSFIAPSTVHVE